MTIGTGLDSCEVNTRVSTLAIDVAGEIPVQITITAGDCRVLCLGDEVTTALIDLLEKEGYIVPSRIPTSFEQGVLTSGPRPHCRMVKVGEVVVETMDDNGGGLDFSGMVSVGGRAANSQGETECKEADASHESEDDTEEAYLLPPCSLLLGCSNAKNFEERGGDAAGDGEAVQEPTVFWTRADGVQATRILLGRLWGGAGTDS